ncbi:RYR1 protein, partial [Eulacestoma nigropectus]|nr:RYR1 protein [Eulacestoma nigropectus]
PGTLQELISQTMVHWAQESFIQSPALVRAMFSLLHGQYDALGELGRALPKAYAISATSVPDTTALLECLGQIRSLLIVQMGPEEENLMIQSIGCVGTGPWDPETPLSTLGVLPDTLRGDPCTPSLSPAVPLTPVSPCVPQACRAPRPWTWRPRPSSTTTSWRWPSRSRTWRRWGQRGPRVTLIPPVSPRVPPCPPDVPCAQVVTYLASCGLQSCPMLLAKGYPDIGWNPCGGEKYLDFLRFAVFVNGESVEENANVVVRLLIR